MPTYDSTTEDQSKHARQSLDGSTTTLESLTVPTGELWWVDGLYVATDGSGDVQGVDLAVAVGETTTLDNMMPTINRAGRGALVGVDTTVSDGGVAEVGAYASENEEIRAVEAHEAGSTGGYHYSLQVRRVV